MGLNSKDIQHCLCRVLQISAEISHTFIQRHPLISSSLMVLCMLYIFFSYILSFLVYISPFLVYTAIIVIIFWSSEQNQFICVEREGIKEENERYGRDKLLVRYPSQNATSRRRNFTGKKLDVYGDLEIKAKDLSEVFHNEFTNKNTRFRESRSFKRGEVSLDDYELCPEKNEAPIEQALFPEPSMCDTVAATYYASGSACIEKEIEDMKVEKEKEAQEGSNRSGELVEDDQRNHMDLGIAVLERTKRLESLIARRRARKILKLRIEKGLADVKSVTPGQIAPLFIARFNPFGSTKDFEGVNGIEMPGSAPPLRSPFDIPYDPFEEKPNLTGDSFDQEFTSQQQQKDMAFSRHESFSYFPCFPLEPRQDRMPFPRNRRHLGIGNHDWFGRLISKQGIQNELKSPNPLNEEEETTHEAHEKCETDMKNTKDEDEAENSHTSEQDTIIPETTNVERDIGSVHESLPPMPGKNQESMFFPNRHISHTPSFSLASDLQVEFSEVGSPTMTVDESHGTITTSDGESMLYDGDTDRDVTSSSEDMWGASLHARELRRVSELDIPEASNWRDIASPNSLQNIDEENAADVSSMSSKSDMADDTPVATHAMSSDHNIFGDVKNVHDQTQREKPEEWCNLTENFIDKTPDINDLDNSATTNEDQRASTVQQETIDEVPINSTSSSSSSSSSPRSVLQHKAVADKASSSTNNQEMHLNEDPLDTEPQNIPHFMDDPTNESHNSDLSHSQERSYPPENPILESNMSSHMNDAYEEKSKNDDDASAGPSRPAATMNSEDMNEKSRELFAGKSSSEVHVENVDQSQASMIQEDTMEPLVNIEETVTNHKLDFEGKRNDLNENESTLSCGSSRSGESGKMSELDKPNHSSEEVNLLQSEANHMAENHFEHENSVTEDTVGESDKMNKDDTMILSDSVGESDEVRNNTHEKA